AATREAIIEAAQELFACQGYARTTVAQVAEAAQVAANTVYTSVGGKPQLLAAITESGTGDPDVAETLTAVARATDPAEVIRLTAAGTRRGRDAPAHHALLPRHPRHPGPATGRPGCGRTARPEPGRRRLLVPVRLDVLADPHHRPRLELGRGRAVAGAAGHRRAAQAGTPQAVGSIAPCGARRELILGPDMARPRAASRAAAHPADQVTHVDTVRHGPRRHLLAVNRVGQVTQGLLGHLRQSGRAQNV